MAKRILTVTIDMGKISTGIWCPACQLPSAISVEVLNLSDRGVSLWGAVTACKTCGRAPFLPGS